MNNNSAKIIYLYSLYDSGLIELSKQIIKLNKNIDIVHLELSKKNFLNNIFKQLEVDLPKEMKILNKALPKQNFPLLLDNKKLELDYLAKICNTNFFESSSYDDINNLTKNIATIKSFLDSKQVLDPRSRANLFAKESIREIIINAKNRTVLVLSNFPAEDLDLAINDKSIFDINKNEINNIPFSCIYAFSNLSFLLAKKQENNILHSKINILLLFQQYCKKLANNSENILSTLEKQDIINYIENLSETELNITMHHFNLTKKEELTEYIINNFGFTNDNKIKITNKFRSDKKMIFMDNFEEIAKDLIDCYNLAFS